MLPDSILPRICPGRSQRNIYLYSSQPHSVSWKSSGLASTVQRDRVKVFLGAEPLRTMEYTGVSFLSTRDIMSAKSAGSGGRPRVFNAI